MKVHLASLPTAKKSTAPSASLERLPAPAPERLDRLHPAAPLVLAEGNPAQAVWQSCRSGPGPSTAPPTTEAADCPPATAPPAASVPRHGSRSQSPKSAATHTPSPAETRHSSPL